MSPREVQHAIALYEGEIASTDAQVGRLMQTLAGSKRLERTLVILTSDHGESLGEHDYFFDHGEYLYDGTLLVPLILRWPGKIPAGKVIKGMVQLTDIAPTALALMGESLPSGLEGRSLVDDLNGSPPRSGERECWIETDHQYVRPENPRHFVPGIEGKWRGIRGERYKLIFIPHDSTGTIGDVELYDLREDPLENNNIAREHPEIAEPLLKRLRAYWSKHGSASAPAAEGAPPDAEILRSLGYI
jgi:arylsulfatase A-like enzyme